jgi:hypothetical protein
MAIKVTTTTTETVTRSLRYPLVAVVDTYMYLHAVTEESISSFVCGHHSFACA